MPPGECAQGDIITGINGKTIRNASDLYRILDHSKVGNSSLTAVRLVMRIHEHQTCPIQSLCCQVLLLMH